MRNRRFDKTVNVGFPSIFICLAAEPCAREEQDDNREQCSTAFKHLAADAAGVVIEDRRKDIRRNKTRDDSCNRGIVDDVQMFSIARLLQISNDGNKDENRLETLAEKDEKRWKKRRKT